MQHTHFAHQLQDRCQALPRLLQGASRTAHWPQSQSSQPGKQHSASRRQGKESAAGNNWILLANCRQKQPGLQPHTWSSSWRVARQHCPPPCPCALPPRRCGPACAAAGARCSRSAAAPRAAARPGRTAAGPIARCRAAGRAWVTRRTAAASACHRVLKGDATWRAEAQRSPPHRMLETTSKVETTSKMLEATRRRGRREERRPASLLDQRTQPGSQRGSPPILLEVQGHWGQHILGCWALRGQLAQLDQQGERVRAPLHGGQHVSVLRGLGQVVPAASRGAQTRAAEPPTCKGCLGCTAQHLAGPGPRNWRQRSPCSQRRCRSDSHTHTCTGCWRRRAALAGTACGRCHT